MKIREWLLLLICAFTLPLAGIAQCGTIHNLTFDTTVAGSGSADPGYDFTMPKFNPSLGTLTTVKVASVVTLSFGLSIENLSPSVGKTKVRANRSDIISGSTIAPDTIEQIGPQTQYTLAGSDGVAGSGPDYAYTPPYYVLNHDTVINRTYSNTAAYLGSGNVTFNYKTDVGSSTSGNYLVNIGGTANDVIKFSITYTYCDNILLASDITSFSASKKDDYIKLLWVTNNELPNHNYELEKSYDGKNFTAIATLPSHNGVNGNASYSYNYVPLSDEKGKLYFRIKQVLGNVPKFTPVRVVDLGDTVESKPDIKLVPNPSNGIFSIMMVNSTATSDWSIELFNIKGQVISKKAAINTTLAKFSMNENLSSGVYFVMVTNRKTSQKFVERMIVN